MSEKKILLQDHATENPWRLDLMRVNAVLNRNAQLLEIRDKNEFFTS